MDKASKAKTRAQKAKATLSTPVKKPLPVAPVSTKYSPKTLKSPVNIVPPTDSAQTHTMAAGKDRDDIILKKLDEIGNDIKGMKTDMITIQNDISGMKTSLSHANDVAQEALDKVNAHDIKFTGIENQFQQMYNVFGKLKSENAQLKDHLLRNECQERRINLILEGIDETDKETDADSLKLVYNALEKDMKIENARGIIKIARCHRLKVRRKIDSRTGLPKPRPIIFKLHYYPDRDKIWRARINLKGTDLWLSEDFPPEIVKRRQVLNAVRKKAIEQGHKAGLSVDKLYVDSKMYTVDTLNQLEDTSLHPTEIYTKRSPLYTAFYSKYSALSNFRPAKFSKDGINFAHNEQYYHFHRAKENGDDDRAKDILQTEDALGCYKIGQSVTIKDEEKWGSRCLEVMYDGLLAKFQQNPELKEFLLSTGNTVLLEASPFDRWWGLGMSINDANLFSPVLWPKDGKNWLGKLLSKVRSKLGPS